MFHNYHATALTATLCLPLYYMYSAATLHFAALGTSREMSTGATLVTGEENENRWGNVIAIAGCLLVRPSCGAEEKIRFGCRRNCVVEVVFDSGQRIPNRLETSNKKCRKKDQLIPGTRKSTGPLGPCGEALVPGSGRMPLFDVWRCRNARGRRHRHGTSRRRYPVKLFGPEAGGDLTEAVRLDVKAGKCGGNNGKITGP